MAIDANEADGEDSWASAYTVDFRKRMLNLLGFEFRHLHSTLALQIINPTVKATSGNDDNQEDLSAISKLSKVRIVRIRLLG